jgi:hypothetical protein
MGQRLGMGMGMERADRLLHYSAPRTTQMRIALDSYLSLTTLHASVCVLVGLLCKRVPRCLCARARG